MVFRALVFLILSLVMTCVAHAGVLLNVEGGLLQETLRTPSNEARTNSYYSAGIFLPANGRETFFMGALVGMGSMAEQNTTGSTTFSHQDMILASKYYLDRQQVFSLTAGYSFLSTATLKNPSLTTAETWRGTGVYAQLTAAPEIKRWFIGVSLVYYQGSFSEKTVSSTTTATSNTRSFLVPTLSLAKRW